MSVFITITFIIPICLNTSFAVTVDDETQIYREIETSLCAIAPEKEYYGLENVDMNNLLIGEKIPTYEVIDRCLEPSSVSLYPIFDNTETLIAIAATTFIDGEAIVSISQTFVDTLSLLATNTQISIIYDKNNTYLLDNGMVTKLTNCSYEDHPNRGDINTLTENTLSSLGSTTLSVKRPLSIANMPKPLGVDDEEVYLSVPIKKQPNNTLCWAASCASIVSYIYNSSYDVEWVANLYDQEGKSTSKITEFLNNYFAIHYKHAYDNDYTNILTSLWANKPVYGHFANLDNTSNTHAVVIRGISYWSVFSAMDPYSATYISGKIRSSGRVKFFNLTMASTGDTYSLWDYAYGSK